MNFLKSKISKRKKILQILMGIIEMNILHNLNKIAYRLSNIEVNFVDSLLKYLIYVNIRRRIDIRLGL